MTPVDIPSPIDLCAMPDALAWERTAMQRPFRQEFFEAFANELSLITQPTIRVLELGSGPGFLARQVLDHIPNLEITLLDFSSAMHELARLRLGNVLNRVTFVERSFKEPGWAYDLGIFEAVITNQAVHELRHKRHATALHQQVRGLLQERGVYLVCDHYCGEDGMQNDQLYMTLDEQHASLQSAGYKVSNVLIKGGRALYRATR